MEQLKLLTKSKWNVPKYQTLNTVLPHHISREAALLVWNWDAATHTRITSLLMYGDWRSGDSEGDV